MRKKVIFVISSMGVGGEQRSLSVLSSKLLEFYDVEIVYFVQQETRIEMDLRIPCIKIDQPSNVSIIKYFRRVLTLYQYFRKSEGSTIVGYGVVAGLFSAMALITLRNELVIAERNDPRKVSFLIKILRSFLYFRAQKAVFQTEDASSYFSDRYFKQRKVIYNLIDEGILKFKTNEKKKIIINVSRFVKAKNHRLLLDAFNIVHPYFPEYELHLYGEGPSKKNILNRIKIFKLESHVKIFEPIHDIYSKLAESNLFVLSSNYEGFPNSLLEAYVLGVPCISTNCPIGGPKEIMKDELEWLVKMNDAKLLSEKIVQYLQLLESNKQENRIVNRFLSLPTIKKWKDLINL